MFLCRSRYTQIRELWNNGKIDVWPCSHIDEPIYMHAIICLIHADLCLNKNNLLNVDTTPGVLFSVSGGMTIGKEGPMIHSGLLLSRFFFFFCLGYTVENEVFDVHILLG